MKKSWILVLSVMVVALVIALIWCCTSKDNTSMGLRGHINLNTGRIHLNGHVSLPKGSKIKPAFTSKDKMYGVPAATTITPPNLAKPYPNHTPIKVNMDPNNPDEVSVSYYFFGIPPTLIISELDANGAATGKTLRIATTGNQAGSWNTVIVPYSPNFAIDVDGTYDGGTVTNSPNLNIIPPTLGLLTSHYFYNNNYLSVQVMDEAVDDFN